MNQFTNVDNAEIDKFGRLAKLWWDPAGSMGMLHTINPLRMKFITESLNINNCKALDVGCGGGILTEALAKAGAQAMGIDLSAAPLKIAQQHAQAQGLHIDYQYASVDEIVAKHAGEFDLVACMEVLEHIPEPHKIVAACARLLKPNGHAFFSTINRNPKSFLFAIVGAEYVLRIMPRGTHTYRKLIRPSELKRWAQKNDLKFQNLASLIYNPFNKKFKVAEKEDVNYMVHFVRN